MADYVLLYSGGKMAEGQAEQAAVMKDWERWMSAVGSALVDVGNPFTGKAKGIATDGRVTDGPNGTNASGYSIIKAESLNSAVELAKGCPVLKGGGKITVFETFKAM
jgi:hypothetical protein